MQHKKITAKHVKIYTIIDLKILIRMVKKNEFRFENAIIKNPEIKYPDCLIKIKMSLS